MKKLFASIALIVAVFYSVAQSPDAFNYQAVARDNAGAALPNANISVRFSIHDATAGGTIVYQETHNLSTNQFGLFTCHIGAGTVLTGDFATVNWAADLKFLQVEFDPAGGTNYSDMGTSQFVSVPYAKAAEVLNIYQGGINNPAKMIITHSPAYQTYGLQYKDSVDKFHFLSNSTEVLTVDVSNKRCVGIGTASPVSPLDVRGNMAVHQDTGLVTVENTGTGSAIHATGMGSALPYGATIFGVNNNQGVGVAGISSGSGIGIYAYNSTGTAGFFEGEVSTTGDVHNWGFTNLGFSGPAIKMKKITGTTAANQGGTSSIAHGLNSGKIISISVMVEYFTGEYVPPSYWLAGFEYTFHCTASNIIVTNSASNSVSVLSSPVRVLIVYEQ